MPILFNSNHPLTFCAVVVGMLAEVSSAAECTCSWCWRKGLGTSQQGALCFSNKGTSGSSYHQVLLQYLKPQSTTLYTRLLTWESAEVSSCRQIPSSGNHPPSLWGKTQNSLYGYIRFGISGLHAQMKHPLNANSMWKFWIKKVDS